MLFHTEKGKLNGTSLKFTVFLICLGFLFVQNAFAQFGGISIPSINIPDINVPGVDIPQDQDSYTPPQPDLQFAPGMPYPKIFVHGINSDCAAMHNLIESIRGDRPYDVKCVTVAGWVSKCDAWPSPLVAAAWPFNKTELPRTNPDSFWNVDYYYNPDGYYDRSVGVEVYAQWFESVVEDIKRATGAEKVIFVAHSMGGLVVRRYMANSHRNWESVHRFVTLGTPSLGVYGVLGGAGLAPIPDVHDCADSSGFIRKLYTDWFDMNQYYKKNNPKHAQNKIWGVVGGVFGGCGKRNAATQGDGIVEIWSSIPGEWLLACQQFDEPAYNTPNYGFRLAYGFKHVDLNTKEAWGSKLAIEWADSNEYADEPNTPGFTVYRDMDYQRNMPRKCFRGHYPLTFTGSIANLHNLLYEDRVKIKIGFIVIEVDGDSWDERKIFNDNISSISIDAGDMEIVVYEHANYQGHSQTLLLQDYPNFAGSQVGNDTISSILVKHSSIKGGNWSISGILQPVVAIPEAKVRYSIENYKLTSNATDLKQYVRKYVTVKGHWIRDSSIGMPIFDVVNVIEQNNEQTLPVYRLYNGTDHFYTTSASESNNAQRGGYRYERIAFQAFDSDVPHTTPLYRFCLANGDHFYTADENEKNLLENIIKIWHGGQFEGILGNIATTQVEGTVPLYRLYNGRDHFYTTSAPERDSAMRGGYRCEGIAGYVFAPPAAAPPIRDLMTEFPAEKLTYSKDIPKVSQLSQNYPNPFNPETWIPYQLAEEAEVTLRIYNAKGQLIRTLDLGHRAPGSYLDKAHAAHWDGTNERGERVASGIYFYRINAGKFTAMRKMVILK